MGMDHPNLHAFRGQAASCRALGSPLTADVLEALADCLDPTTRTGAAVLAWPGEPLPDALPLRLAGALHALARSGEHAALTDLYRSGSGAAAVIPDLVRERDDWLLPWLDSPPQTNEVGRSAALVAGLAVAAQRLAMPFELLELGASAGLNLNLDRFQYQLGKTPLGPPSPVALAPEWVGESPPGTMPVIVRRAGVDRQPIDVADPANAERLIAYVWPDQHDRVRRIEGAITLAGAHPPPVEQGDAADWIEGRLLHSQDAGCARVVMHSVFWQYLPGPSQARIARAIEAAGARADAVRPLVWLRFEPGPNLWTMALTLRIWPGGREELLAHCHPHGAHIGWKG